MTTSEVIEELIKDTDQKIKFTKMRISIPHGNKGLQEAREELEKLKERRVHLLVLQNLEENHRALEKMIEDTEPCCPYDNEKCTKTGCFMNGGPCSRRTKQKEPTEQDGLNPQQVYIDDWMAEEHIEPLSGGRDDD